MKIQSLGLGLDHETEFLDLGNEGQVRGLVIGLVLGLVILYYYINLGIIIMLKLSRIL